MKRYFSLLILVLLFLLGLSSCGKTTTTELPNETPADSDKEDTSLSNDMLIVYFSCTQTTEKIAEYISDKTGGTRYQLQPKVPYTEEDLKYYTNGRADKEQADSAARPEISGSIEDFNHYKTIFIGYPIWHGQAPKIIYTFLESYDFSGKILIPFCTSHSSDIGSSDTNLHSLAANAEWKSGRRFSSNTSKDVINDWIDSLGIKNETEEENMQIYFTIGATRLTATLEDNTATKELKEKLKTEAITIQMSDYGGFEKVGDFGFDLPTSNEQITTMPCEFVLYQGNKLVIFYESNSWSYTRLGKITGISSTELKKLLGNGSVTITLSMATVSSFNLASGVNGCAPTVMLNSGYEMPVLGIGTYSLHGDTCVNSVLSALQSGVRLIDTAYMYGNEAQVGQAIRQSGISREEIFVITKIYPGEQFLNPEKAINEALDKLNIGYIDMMLLHHPGTNDVQAYKAIEKFVEQGKIRSIGLSNWYIEEIDNFISQVTIKPALVQNEIHPYYQEQAVVPYVHHLGIVMQAWYPFGGRGHTAALLSDPAIVKIANAHNITAAQVILRWHLQRGVVAIPGSSNPEHIKENISVFDFELSESEMDSISKLDRNEKHDWY